MNHSPTKSLFDRDYYENGVAAGVSCYTDYRWLPEMTIPMARAIRDHLGLTREDAILDYGCAKGFLVKALRMEGFRAFGADVSEYAIKQADEFTAPFVRLIQPGEAVPLWTPDVAWSWIIAKDVLEHLTEDEIRGALRMFRKHSDAVFIVVPLGDGERYVIPEMEKDVTHKTRQTLAWWEAELNAAGFVVAVAEYAVPGIKEKWTNAYPEGNGFIMAT